MRVKSIVTVGFLSVMAATAVGNVSDSFASDAHRVDVIGTLHSKSAQADSGKTAGEATRVDVIDRVGSEGPVYPYTKPMSR